MSKHEPNYRDCLCTECITNLFNKATTEPFGLDLIRFSKEGKLVELKTDWLLINKCCGGTVNFENKTMSDIEQYAKENLSIWCEFELSRIIDNKNYGAYLNNKNEWVVEEY
ncbi:hypothetical protein LD119_00699 [Mesoplasma sp. JKS002660]|uniref:hypothetical protein n=1 Tax=Mesoplasma whartonense TaxID=2878854 RepID=UPI0020229FCA|nr:hypothetical protein [Mesoplasma sp. JKS002660]MCL8213748.1 hypothetical protein [Mesoplasma sp. JKS002660]